MNKCIEARNILNTFRNAHYNDVGCEETKVVAQALNEVLPYLVATEKELEELKEKQGLLQNIEYLQGCVDTILEYSIDDDKALERLRIGIKKAKEKLSKGNKKNKEKQK
jgi:hypothetical protein